MVGKGVLVCCMRSLRKWSENGRRLRNGSVYTDYCSYLFANQSSHVDGGGWQAKKKMASCEFRIPSRNAHSSHFISAWAASHLWEQHYRAGIPLVWRQLLVPCDLNHAQVTTIGAKFPPRAQLVPIPCSIWRLDKSATLANKTSTRSGLRLGFTNPNQWPCDINSSPMVVIEKTAIIGKKAEHLVHHGELNDSAKAVKLYNWPTLEQLHRRNFLLSLNWMGQGSSAINKSKVLCPPHSMLRKSTRCAAHTILQESWKPRLSEKFTKIT